MSNALTPETPEASAAAPSVEEPAPVDGTAVAEGSAGGNGEYVEASRFNGLMSAHQKALNALEAERQARAALEARINNEEKPSVEANDAVLEEVQALRAELQRTQMANAKAEALRKYPAAAPLADLIVGSTPEEVESVAAAIATRLDSLGAPTPEPPADEQAAPTGAEGAPVEEEAPEVPPVIAGGQAAPTEPSNASALTEAIDNQDWGAYWTAKAGPLADANLG